MQRAIEGLHQVDPERVALYEQQLAELTWAYRQVGWRKFRSGPSGIEVEVQLGRRALDLPVTAEEALALAAGRAHVYTRSAGGSAHRVEIRACEPCAPDERERPSRPAAPPDVAEERTRKLAAIESRLARLDELVARLRAERDELVAQDAHCAA